MAKMKYEDLVWKVYYHDSNHNEITTVNVFDWYNIHDYIEKAKHSRKHPTKVEFDDGLKREMKWMFWARCEYEVVIREWVGHETSKKIDIYQQVANNWQPFVDMAWNYVSGGWRKVED